MGKSAVTRRRSVARDRGQHRCDMRRAAWSLPRPPYPSSRPQIHGRCRCGNRVGVRAASRRQEGASVGSAEACGKIPNDKFHGLQRGWRPRCMWCCWRSSAHRIHSSAWSFAWAQAELSSWGAWSSRCPIGSIVGAGGRRESGRRHGDCVVWKGRAGLRFTARRPTTAIEITSCLGRAASFCWTPRFDADD
jgi:hypothetical protein